MIKLVLITYKYNDTREYLRWDALYCHKSRNIHRLIYRDISLHNRPEHKYYEHLKNEKIADSKRFPIKQYIAHHDEEESLQLIKHMIANGFDVSICWDFIAEQDSKLAISMIENKSYTGLWGALCANPDAVEFIKKSIGKNIDKINWSQLCLNPHNDVISILRKHPQKICWSNICSNLNKSIINMCGKDK